jgi:hypothetical protein
LAREFYALLQLTMNTIDYNAELLLMPARGYFDEYPGHF